LNNDVSWPGWADAELSAGLRRIIDGGEGQGVEFKAMLPRQVSDLAKEIAAFATTNEGLILLGVRDDGTAIGLGNLEDHAERESLRQRIEGLCASSIKPSITPALRFALLDGAAILAIRVPKGGAPIYYTGGVPYLRQLSSSRPMNPDEVIDAVLAWHSERQPKPPSDEELFLSDLRGIVVRLRIGLDELKLRDCNPWFSYARDELDSLVKQAYELAANAPPKMIETIAELRALADATANVAEEEMTFSSDTVEMEAARVSVLARIDHIAGAWLPAGSFTPGARDQVDRLLQSQDRKLSDLVLRLDSILGRGRSDELQQDVGDAGLEIRRAAGYLFLMGYRAKAEAFERLGRRLREIQTRETYAMDGGASRRALAGDLSQAASDLKALLAT